MLSLNRSESIESQLRESFGVKILETLMEVESAFKDGSLYTYSFAGLLADSAQTSNIGGIGLESLKTILSFVVFNGNPNFENLRSDYGKAGKELIERVNPLNIKQKDSDRVESEKLDKIGTISANTEIDWQKIARLLSAYCANGFNFADNLKKPDASMFTDHARARAILSRLIRLMGVDKQTANELTKVKVSGKYQSAMCLDFSTFTVNDDLFMK